MAAESATPYYRFALSAGVGPAFIKGDLDNRLLGAGGFIRADYYLRHGLSIGIEGHQGLLRSGGAEDVDVHPVSLLFFTGVLSARLEPLAFIQNNHDRRVMYRKGYLQKVAQTAYIGAGFGGMLNFTRSVEVTTYDNGHFFGAVYHADLGVDLPLSSMAPYVMDSFFWYLNINGQLNFAANRGMDGFPDQRDRYGIVSIGVKLKL